jgi:hypothetical protein
MKANLALLGAGVVLLLGASCAQTAKDDAADPMATKREAVRLFEKRWKAEQRRQQEIADKEAEAKKRYYAEYIRQHGYPTHADRERAIREAVKASGDR